MYLPQLSDAELLTYLYQQPDHTKTEMEKELAKRLEKLLGVEQALSAAAHVEKAAGTEADLLATRTELKTLAELMKTQAEQSLAFLKE